MPIVPNANRTKSILAGAPYSPSTSFNPDKKLFFDTHVGNLGVLAGGVITSDGVNVTVPSGTRFIHNGIIVELTSNFIVPIAVGANPKYLVAYNDDETSGSNVTIEFQPGPPVNMVLLATLTPNDTTVVMADQVSIRGLYGLSGAHKDRHKTGGADAFTGSDLLDAIARVILRKNSGADVGARRRINLIEGSGITVTIADDAGDEELDVTLSSSATTRNETVRWNGIGKVAVITNLDGAWVAPRAGTISRITLHRRIAGTSGQATVDVNKNGTTVFTTQANRPTVLYSAGDNQIDAHTDMDVTSFAQDDYFQVDVDVAEGGNPQDVSVTMEVIYT